MDRFLFCLLLAFLILLLPLTVYASDQAWQERDILLVGARNARAAGHYEDAIKRYQRLLSQYPDLTGVRLEYADFISELCRKKESIAEIKKIIAVSPEDVNVLRRLADEYIAIKDFKEAAEILQRILKFTPHDLNVLRKLADAQRNLIDSFPDSDTAIREIKKLLKTDPDNDIFRERLVDLLRWGHRYDESLSYCREALKRKQTPFWTDKCDAILREEVDWLVSKNEFDTAIIILSDLVSSHPTDIELKKRFAMVLAWGKYYITSIKQFEEILEITPEDDELRGELIEVAGWAKEYDTAIKHCLILLKKYPEDINLRRKYISLLEAGNLKEDLIRELSQLIKKAPADLEAKYRLAMLYEEKEEFINAEELLRDIVQRDRYYRDSAYHLALVLSWNKKYDEAINEFEGLLKEDNKNLNYILGYAETLFYAGRIKDSKRVLSLLLKKEPINVKFKVLYAEILLRELNFTGAEFVFREILRDDPISLKGNLGLIDTLTSLRQFEEAKELIKRLKTIEQIDKNELSSRRSLILGYQNRFLDAYQELEKITSTDTYPLKEVVGAELLNVEGLYFQSEQNLKEVLTSHPDDYRINLAYIESLKGQEDYERAAPIYEKLLKKYPEDLKLRLEYAELSLIRREWVRAEEIIKEILEEYPESLRALYLHFRLYYLKGDKELAEASFQRFVGAARNIDLRDAVLIQGLLLHDKMYKELVAFSQTFPTKAAIENDDFLTYLLEGIKRQGNLKMAEQSIIRLLDKSPDNQLLNLTLSEMRFYQGDEREARELLKKASKLDLQNKYKNRMVYMAYLVKDYDLSASLTIDILQSDPDNIYARADYLRLLSLKGKVEFEEGLAQFLPTVDDLPIPVRFDLVKYMAFNSAGKEDPVFKASVDIIKRTIKEDSQNEEARITLARILSSNNIYNESIETYKGLIIYKETHPLLKHALAELYSWNTEYDKSIKTYDEYLALKPYDLMAMRKQARVYGWWLRYESSLKRYDDILMISPKDRSVYLEKEAKYNFWRQRFITALKLYHELEYTEPQNEEALFDSGQIYSREGFYERTEEIYRYLLYLVPKHKQAIMALKAVELYQRPKLELEYIHNRERGYDNKKSITYDDFAASLIIHAEDGSSIKGRYDRVRFKGKDIDAEGYTLWGDHKFNLNLSITCLLGGWVYREGDKNKVVFGAQTQYKTDDYRVKIGYDRSPLWENITTVQSNTHFDRLSAGIEGFMFPEISHRLIPALNISWSRFSDSNRRWTGDLSVAYEVTPFPGILKIIPKIEYLDFAGQKEEYFTPTGYTKYGINIEWRQFLNKDYFHEADKIYYALQTGISHDSLSNDFLSLGGEVFYEIYQRFGINLRLELIRSDDYDKDNISLNLYYRF